MAGYFDELKKAIIEEAKKKSERAFQMALEEVIPIAALRIQTIFDEAINDFYISYNPTVYKRNFSLYSIASIRHGGASISIQLSEDGVTPWNNGGSISGAEANYIAAFKNGIHGRSSIVSQSPRLLFINELRDYWEGGEFTSLLERQFYKNWEKTKWDI